MELLGDVLLAMPAVLVSLLELGVVLVLGLMSVLELGDVLLEAVALESVVAARELSVVVSVGVLGVVELLKVELGSVEDAALGAVELVLDVGLVELVGFKFPLVVSVVVLAVP